MKSDIYSILHISIFVLLLITACGTQQLEMENKGIDAGFSPDSTAVSTIPLPSEDIQPTPSETITPTLVATQRHTFEELGISLEVPADLYVKKDPIVSFDDINKLESYLFYIQNYGYPGGPSSGDFQMYGSLQYSLPPMTWEEFADIQNKSTEYEYVNYIEINGLRGFDTQFAGQRNNFVYLFFLDNQVLRIAVSSPTPENKALAEQILSSLEINPEGLSDVSHMKLVSDPNKLYQILIPDDWDFNFQPTVGTTLARLEARSADSDFFSEDVGGPHANVYYRSGIFMTLHVLKDDSANNPPFPNLIRRQYDVYFNGIQGTEYVFTEPSTVEGEMREAQVYYEGKSYFLRFAYANETYRDVIDRIIAGFIVTPETFYPTQ